ncbi:hypothetical protein [Paracoccus cavernae]|uniref:hypothetical protein n=1 Tax=Paracoccus cavernae TaxID=1571207 RepID=UPI003638F382
MAEDPDLVVSAGFSDAQLVKEANKVVAFYKKRGEEAQKAFLDAQGKVTNTQAANAHKREMDKLARAYDPAYRAAKGYEKQVEELSRAMKGGAITQQQYVVAVERAARQLKQAGRSVRLLAESWRAAGTPCSSSVGRSVISRFRLARARRLPKPPASSCRSFSGHLARWVLWLALPPRFSFHSVRRC